MKNKKSAVGFLIVLTEQSVCSNYLHNFTVSFLQRPIFFPDTFILRNEKDMTPNRLRYGIGAAGECIS